VNQGTGGPITFFFLLDKMCGGGGKRKEGKGEGQKPIVRFAQSPKKKRKKKGGKGGGTDRGPTGPLLPIPLIPNESRRKEEEKGRGKKGKGNDCRQKILANYLFRSGRTASKKGERGGGKKGRKNSRNAPRTGFVRPNRRGGAEKRKKGEENEKMGDALVHPNLIRGRTRL